MSRRPSVVLPGEPMRLDVVYRPMAWGLLLPPAVVIGALLFWWGRTYLAPMPLVAAWVVHTAIFWARGDRPCQVKLLEDAAVLEDPRRGQHLKVDLERVHSATMTLRKRPGGSTALVVLWDRERPLLALRAACPATQPSAEEVDGDLISASIGGDGGTAYAFAPVGAVCRQLLQDPDGALIAWYRSLPRDVRQRTQIRLWQGKAPTLDLLGRHEENWSATLTADADGLTLRQDGTTAIEGTWTWHRAERRALLLTTPDGFEGTAQTNLELAVLAWGSQTLAFPAGLAGDLGEERELTEDGFHTHSGEGGALITHLLRHTPRADWPRPVADALLEARAYLGGPQGELG